MGLLRDCTTGCGTDGSFYSTTHVSLRSRRISPDYAPVYCGEVVTGAEVSAGGLTGISQPLL